MSDPFTGPMPLETRIDSILTEAFDGLAWDHSRDNVDMNSLLNTIEDVTPRILAAVAEALTSDEAVDAMLYRSYGWADYDEGTTYLDLPEKEKADIRDVGRNEIGGALEAAGIAKGEDE